MISETAPGVLVQPAAGLSRRRRLAGLAVAAVGGPVLTAALVPLREHLGLHTVLLAFVLISVAASAVGGVVPATVATLFSFGLANFFFTRPYGTLAVAEPSELVDLLVFLTVSVLVGVIAELGARARVQVDRDRLRAEWLAGLEASQHDRTSSLESVLDVILTSYNADGVALTSGSTVLASAGRWPSPGQLSTASAGEGLQVQVVGPERFGSDPAPLAALATTAGRLWRSRVLLEQARHAEELRRIDEVRSSLLAAVGHDLRGPLAAIRAAAATLRQPELDLDPADSAELLASIEEQVGRLDEIIANLLDLSRLRAGVLSVQLAPTSLIAVAAAVLRYGADRIVLDIPDDLPLVRADFGLLERVLVNLVSNSDRHLPEGESVTIRAQAASPYVQLAVIDHGPGVAPERFDEIFLPFQHFSDRSAGGVGLGLATARGFTEAMGGRIVPSQTPGGGLTMTITLEEAR